MIEIDDRYMLDRWIDLKKSQQERSRQIVKVPDSRDPHLLRCVVEKYTVNRGAVCTADVRLCSASWHLLTEACTSG